MFMPFFTQTFSSQPATDLGQRASRESARTLNAFEAQDLEKKHNMAKFATIVIAVAAFAAFFFLSCMPAMSILGAFGIAAGSLLVGYLGMDATIAGINLTKLLKPTHDRMGGTHKSTEKAFIDTMNRQNPYDKEQARNLIFSKFSLLTHLIPNALLEKVL